MRAFLTAVIYFGTFLTIGLVARALIDHWMDRKGADLADVQGQAGQNRRPRQVFLLGAWRTED